MADYSKFLHSNGCYYAWVEVPITMLQLTAPADATNAKKNVVYDDETGEETSYELKTMTEYLTLDPIISEDGTKCICLLNEAQEPRRKGVDEGDLAFWDSYLAEYNIGSDVWMSSGEKNELLTGGDYDNFAVGEV